MIKDCIALIVGLALGGGAESVLAVEDTAVADRLAAAAPVMDTRQPGLRSFRAGGAVDLGGDAGGIKLAFECAYEAPDQKACLLSDALDGIPIFIAAGDRALIYDPLSGVREYVPVGWFFWIRQQESDLEFRWGVATNKEDGYIQFDLQSLMGHVPQDRTATPVGPNRLQLTARTPSGKGRIEASLDLTLASPYTGLKVIGEDRVFLELHTLAIDRGVPAAALRFPDLLGLPDRPAAPQLTLDNFGDMMQGIFRSVFLRAGLHNPAQRHEIETQFGRQFDWSYLVKQDAVLGASLKQAVEERSRQARQ